MGEIKGIMLTGCMDWKAEPGILETYMEVMENKFFQEEEYETLRYSVAEKTINSYSRASGDFEEKMDLILFYVEGEFNLPVFLESFLFRFVRMKVFWGNS